jgi:hypothetical protein
VSTNGKNGKGASDGVTPKQHVGGCRPAQGRQDPVAIVGVGNCASSLVQGRYYYENAKKDDFVPGLMHVDLGGYHVKDIEFVRPSTSTRTRSARTSPRPSTPSRTTPTSSRRSSRSA